MSSIKISQWNQPISEGKGTILDRALQQGVPYPHSCRSGECGQCKTLLINGEVQELPCLDTALSADERRANLVLACRSIAKTDVEVAWVESSELNPFIVNQFIVEVKRIDRRGNVLLMSLNVVDKSNPLQFAPGQYVKFIIPGYPARPYSIASICNFSQLDFHIEVRDGGLVSSGIATELRPGDQFTIEGPYGDAYLREDEEGPLLAVGANTGMAPILSIVTSALVKTPKRRVSVFYLERSASHQYLQSELQILSDRYSQLKVKAILTGDGANRKSYMHDQITTNMKELSYPLAEASIYLAGSPHTVEIVSRAVKLLGAVSSRVRADAFTHSTEAAKSSPSLAVRLSRIFTSARN